MTVDSLEEICETAYGSEWFIRLLGSSRYPDIKNVVGTNLLEMAWRVDPRTGRVILMSGVGNNLVKESRRAGHIRCFNVMNKLGQRRFRPSDFVARPLGEVSSCCIGETELSTTPNRHFLKSAEVLLAPKGFRASAVRCGITRRDVSGVNTIGLFCSGLPGSSCGHVHVQQDQSGSGASFSSPSLRARRQPRAIIANSGNANACTGITGIQNAKKMAQAVARQLGFKDRQVLVCSTGRIGRHLPIEKIESAVPDLVAGLSANGSEDAAKAIMTSDTFHKEIAVELPLHGKSVRIGGIAKGAGMINPNMATMLCFITTDAPISKRDLPKDYLRQQWRQSFNCQITIDGDMSTNDHGDLCLANGRAGIAPIEQDKEEYGRFSDGLNFVTRQLARMIVEDGEGVTKFVEVHVKGAATYQDARKAARKRTCQFDAGQMRLVWRGSELGPSHGCGSVTSSAKVREEMIDIFFNGAIAVPSMQDGEQHSLEETTHRKSCSSRFTVYHH